MLIKEIRKIRESNENFELWGHVRVLVVFLYNKPLQIMEGRVFRQVCFLFSCGFSDDG